MLRKHEWLVSGLELCCPLVAVFQARPLLVRQVGTGCAQAAHFVLHHCIILFCGNLDGVLQSRMALDWCIQSWAVFAAEYREDEFSERRDDSGCGNPSRLCL